MKYIIHLLFLISITLALYSITTSNLFTSFNIVFLRLFSLFYRLNSGLATIALVLLISYRVYSWNSRKKGRKEVSRKNRIIDVLFVVLTTFIVDLLVDLFSKKVDFLVFFLRFFELLTNSILLK